MSAPPLRVLIWTEAHWVGGSDRFLVDLVRALDDRFAWRLAGIESPDHDRWLARQLPDVSERIVVPIASLPGSPLTALRRRLSRGDQPPADLSAAASDVSVPVKAAVAALRYRHAATNLMRLGRLMHRARPDVLMINNGGYPGGESCRYAAIAARRAGVPRVVHFVHNMAYPPNWPPVVERAIDARVDGAVDAWVTAARRASVQLADVRGMRADRVHTVHYGVPPAPQVAAAARGELGYVDGALALAVVAALEPRKGHLVLLNALKMLRERGTEVRTALVGAGPEEPRLRRRVAELGLGEHVRILGRRDDVDAILRASDALALPSLSNECLPYAILEAMAHGLPVVGTDVAGIPEEIDDGVTGHVVAPGHAPSLADAIAALAADPARRRAMGEAGRGRVRSEFGIERMVDAVTALWAP